VARYSFSDAPDVLGAVADDSGNGNVLKVGAVSGGLGPPTWGLESGVSGGGMSFFADTLNADYLASDEAAWAAGVRSVAVWSRGGPSGNRVGVPFCVSNWVSGEAFVPMGSKSEVAVQLDQSTGTVSAWATVDGTTMWMASTSGGLFSAGVWTHVVVVHDGDGPAAYVNGTAAAMSFSVDVDRTAWIGDAVAADSPADRVFLGGAPRPYSPYVALGFSGVLDEVVLWDAPLSGSAVLAEFAKAESYSSASSSSMSTDG